VILEDGTLGRAAVPSGASTGIHEAVELRDGDSKIYQGKGVLKAVENVNTVIAEKLRGIEASEQEKIDETLIALDGTANKGKLGANAILAASMATAHAAAASEKMPLFAYFQKIAGLSSHEFTMPVPQINIMNGGAHANFESTDIQEFMILPVGAHSFSHAIQMSAEVFHNLGSILKGKGYATTVGDECVYAPKLKEGNKEALDLIEQAVNKAGYSLGKDFVLGLDVAASEFFENNTYTLRTENNKTMTQDEMIEWIANLVNNYPLGSIEDIFAQEDWESWQKFTSKFYDRVQIVGDDLLVTNIDFLKKGIDMKAANSIIIKLNQIGTVSETLAAIDMAHKAGWNSIVAHRSGETEDTTISHLVVGLQTGQIKTGSTSRGERTAKYNELMRIEEMLGSKAVYKGREVFKH
jgi:enolase